jgi:hypothetical protein
MKTRSLVAVVFSLSFVLSVSSATLTNDPLTGLPLIPATDSRLHLGNEPTKLPDTTMCKSKMQTDFYSVFDTKVSATLSWYAARLPGFKKTHGYASGRSQDTFYNAGGTIIVAITGDPGQDGEDTGAYGMVYAKFQPGLPEKTIISINIQKVVCP